MVKVCAKRPTVTLLISLVVIIALSVGTIYMEVTTDPIELWSAKVSRARREKDYFDDKFGPFYRTTQIFIRPTNTDNVRPAFAFMAPVQPFLQFANFTPRNTRF